VNDSSFPAAVVETPVDVPAVISNVDDAPARPDPTEPEQPKLLPPLPFAVEARIFLSTFATIFLAELGDKTQVTTLLMSAESQAPWVVFVGAGAALVTTSLIGVLVGRWLAKRVSVSVLETSVGILLLGISLALAWDVVQAI
jgi:putative Ca2+/H+ antiporter (TMEM165/GDT1 family)